MFNDGVCAIYAVTGERRSEALTSKTPLLRFEKRIVGAKRFYTAMSENVSIADVIRTPNLDDINVGDIVVIDEVQYAVVQKQRISDTAPISMDLTLSKATRLYAFAETEAL